MQTKNQKSRKLICLLVFLFGLLLISTSNNLVVEAQYQVNFDFGFTAITASVPDIIEPSVPILITPEDGEVVVVTKPSFSWYGSSDNVGVTRYELWIDDTIYLNSILPVDQDVAVYTLVVDTDNNTLSLTIKQALLEGSHNWRIVAADAANNQSTSATWNFEIDTVAPELSIHSIEGNAVLITTQNTQTIPTDPIVTVSNSPLISGLTEPFTTLYVFFSLPDQPTTTTTYAVGASGMWSYQFPTLPSNQVATLTLLVQDDVGHTNVLTPIRFIFDPAPTPTPAPSGVVVVTTTPTGTAPSPTPTISTLITLTPSRRPTPRPRIVLPGLTATPTPTIRFSDRSPIQPVLTVLNEREPEYVLSQGKNATWYLSRKEPIGWQLLAPILLLLPLLILIGSIAKKMYRAPFWVILHAIWWVLFGDQDTAHGKVENSKNNKPLWLIPIKRHSKSNTSSDEFIAITNRKGVFKFFSIDKGVHTFTPVWQNLLYPTKTKRPQSTPWHRHYLREKIEIRDGLPLPMIIIPVDQLQKQSNMEERLLLAMEWKGTLVVMQTIALTTLYVLNPTTVTAITFIISLCMGLVRFYKSHWVEKGQ